MSSLKIKLENIKNERADKDKKEGLLRDVRVSFDKYLRFYAKDSKQLKR